MSFETPCQRHLRRARIRRSDTPSHSENSVDSRSCREWYENSAQSYSSRIDRADDLGWFTALVCEPHLRGFILQFS